MNNRWLFGLFAVTVMGIAITVFALRRFTPPPDPVQLLSQAREALRNQQFELAERTALRVSRHDTLWPRALLIAGEAAMRSGRLDEAINHYLTIPDDGSAAAGSASFYAAEILRDQGRLSEAQQHYLNALKADPENAAIHERLAFLQGITGRRWEALPHYEFLLRSGQINLEELCLLADLERPMEQVENVRKCVASQPDDPYVQMAHGALEITEGHADSARAILRHVTQSHPEISGAFVLLGELLLDGDEREFLAWHSRLPPEADRIPDTWLIRGMWARRQGKLPIAARCFWETLRRLPTHRRATYQLNQVLIALQAGIGRDFEERSANLFELTHQLDIVLHSQGRSEPAMRSVVELLEQAGRLWEAAAWARVSHQLHPEVGWPMAVFQRVTAQLTPSTPLMLESSNLAIVHDLSHYPDYRSLFSGRTGQSENSPMTPPRPVGATIRFEEEVTVDFVYVNGADPLVEPAVAAVNGVPARPARIIQRTRVPEQTGGGVAVLDFDLDQYPDLFFPQGTDWKFGSQYPTPTAGQSDRLFQNRAGKAFVDISLQAGIGDDRFGQGCAAGDFDNDGFLDLYVANIGQNQLYRNNGDGTFQDVSELAGINDSTWTASCAIVDLNADGVPDLFDANYLMGPGVYDRVCSGHACSPKVFDGCPDVLRIGLGDGRFDALPDIAPQTDGKGLAVVAVDLTTRGRPDLFVANDQVPNFFLQNSPSNDPRNVKLENVAFTSGVAFNEDGLAMASMGVAADDFNGDGLIDLYVTTYQDETRLFFLQQSNGLFVDAAKSSGLRGPGLPFVGWGTQSIDADLDGNPDLVVVNGHVDDYREEGGAFKMRPQFLYNQGGGRFVERFAADVGQFFSEERRGRGLARLDWNRDGLMDFAVSNIGDRASMISNATTHQGHFVSLRLHATTTARDAIGAVATVRAGGKTWKKQLVGGDGYMATNERLLQFGVGSAEAVSEIHVDWPSGHSTLIVQPPLDATLRLIEGSPRATVESSHSAVPNRNATEIQVLAN